MDNILKKGVITRRKFFQDLCTKDTFKNILGAWYGFNTGIENAPKLSCDEAGHRLGRSRKSEDRRNSLDINEMKGGRK